MKTERGGSGSGGERVIQMGRGRKEREAVEGREWVRHGLASSFVIITISSAHSMQAHSIHYFTLVQLFFWVHSPTLRSFALAMIRPRNNTSTENEFSFFLTQSGKQTSSR